MKNSEQHIKIHQKLYELGVWFFNHTEKFPKSKRFSLSVRIETVFLSLIEESYLVQFKKEKRSLLLKLSDGLESLRILTRFSLDANCLNKKSYEYAIREMDEIGKMLGGWIRSLK